MPGASTLWMSWRIPPDVNSGGTLRNVPPLLSHRSLYAVSFDGYAYPFYFPTGILYRPLFYIADDEF